ncbi:MAG: KamA family radical SAM protein, partial [bacterium]
MPIFNKRFQRRMWAAAPEIKTLLGAAPTFEEARLAVFDYLEARKREIRAEEVDLPSWEWEVVDDCIDVLKNIFSAYYEKSAKFSGLRTLWQLARGKYSGRRKELSPGFFEEFRHLFLGIAGRSPIYEGKELPTHSGLHGRKAALARSRDLDLLAGELEKGLARYPSGLDEDLIAERRHNAARVRELFGVSDDEWSDWHWQFDNVIRDRKTLQKIITLSRDEAKAVDLATRKGVPFGITPYYASLMRRRISRSRVHATRAQVIPPLEYVQRMVKFRGRREFECDFMLE